MPILFVNLVDQDNYTDCHSRKALCGLEKQNPGVPIIRLNLVEFILDPRTQKMLTALEQEVPPGDTDASSPKEGESSARSMSESSRTLNSVFLPHLQQYVPRSFSEFSFSQLVVAAHGSYLNHDYAYYAPSALGDRVRIISIHQFAYVISMFFAIANLFVPHERLIPITLCMCYSARSKRYFLDHCAMDPVNFRTSFAARFLKIMRKYLIREMDIELTAFTNTVSFSDDLSGAFLVETEKYFQLRRYAEKVNKRFDEIGRELGEEANHLDLEDQDAFFELVNQEDSYPYRMAADVQKAGVEQVTLMNLMSATLKEAPQYGMIIFRQAFGLPLEIDATHMNTVASDVAVVDVLEGVSEEEPDRQQPRRCTIL